VSDLAALAAYPNEPDAQVAAAALRDAGLHPVVLGHDPLAQLLQPHRAARLLVPEEELAAARELLGVQELAQPEVVERVLLRALLGSLSALFFIAATALAPRLLPLWAALAGVAWLILRRARRRAL
jgi:hypothetical protein